MATQFVLWPHHDVSPWRNQRQSVKALSKLDHRCRLPKGRWPRFGLSPSAGL